jgi:hypothetical protein
MEIKINLTSDWTQYLRSAITAAGYSVSATESLDELSYKYFNIRKRTVPDLCRAVHESRKLLCPQEHQLGYSALKTKFVTGNAVTPHLSKTILSDSYEDQLLNDWGIHHFHLGQNVSNGFADRTGPLLFALVTNTDVYCIDIKSHGAWSEQEFIKTLHEEWPEAIQNYRINGVLGLAYQPTNDDISTLRRAGVQTMIQIEEGVVYGPIGGGYSSAGTSVESRMLACRFQRMIIDIEKNVKENAGLYVDKIREQGLEPGSELRFELLVNEKGFYVVEAGSRVAFLVHQHHQG